MSVREVNTQVGESYIGLRYLKNPGGSVPALDPSVLRSSALSSCENLQAAQVVWQARNRGS